MQTNRRILIVDDASIIRSTLTTILENEGYEVVAVRNGRQALAQVAEEPFNLVLLDVKLPDVQGEELIAPLKQAQPDIGIVILTGQASKESAIRALNEGAAAYITKPWRNEEGLATMRSVLEKQRLVLENRRLMEEMQQELADRRRIEQALRASERRLSTLLSNLPGMAYRYRVPDGASFQRSDEVSVEFVSQGSLELTGFTPARLLQGREFGLMELIHPEDRQRVREEIAAALREQRPFTITYRIRTRDGSEKWVWEQGRPTLADEEGKVLEGFITDITEGKRAVLASEEQRAVTEALTDTMAALNSRMELKQVLDRILTNIGRVVPHRSAHIRLIKGDCATLVGNKNGQSQTEPEPREAWALRVDEVPVLRKMAASRRPLVVPEVREYEEWIEIPGLSWIRSYAGAPICLQAQTVGFLCLNSDRPSFYNEGHGQQLEVFANQTATAIAMAGGGRLEIG